MRHIALLLAAASSLWLSHLRPVDAGEIFADNFNSGASPLWGDQTGAWSAAGGVYFTTQPNNFPSAHSTLPFSLTDFVVEVDVNKLYDGGIWLRSTEEPGTPVGIEGVLLVTGGTPQGPGTGTGLYWHIVTDPSTYGPGLNDVFGFFTPGVSDAHIRVVVAGDTYSAYVDGSSTPATTLTTSAFTSGGVGLYDFSNQTFDNFVLSTVPEPSSLALMGLGMASSLVSLGLRRPRLRSIS